MDNLWAKAVEVSLGKLEVKQTFIQGLDRLFNILSCKYQIRSCAEVGCSPDCAREAHIDCRCSREMKIPYIKGQREKVGSVGPHQIGPVDIPGHRRQVAATQADGEEGGRGGKEEKAGGVCEEGGGGKEGFSAGGSWRHNGGWEE
ncbi:putative leucine zipper transcription factor-like protein 1-like 3 [Homarus americanus]|uniref:Putative leucine zipper transcription factor-like protein 1-like 3 n=1 Tax=Homarus americanus TaxID=6706 RepID=A0A8J5TKB3_HOMAM|nr:putative leucine zipper transcription factor-like protein 1-like 3 [Homarus americanus]